MNGTVLAFPTLRNAALCGLVATFPCGLPARGDEPALDPFQASWSLRVHLLTDDHRVQLRRMAGAKDDALVCKAPCGVVVDFRESDAFNLGGPGLIESGPFQQK
jgi:hypothetical protein